MCCVQKFFKILNHSKKLNITADIHVDVVLHNIVLLQKLGEQEAFHGFSNSAFRRYLKVADTYSNYVSACTLHV